MFDPDILPKRVNQDPKVDMVATSACNFYDGVTQKEAENFYTDLRNSSLNSGQDTTSHLA